VYGTDAHDDYLITPQINVTAGVNDRISFYIQSGYASYFESYEVVLSTTDNSSAASFTDVLKPESEAPSGWNLVTIELDAYATQDVYVAIRATDTNEFYLTVDSFVNDGLPSCPVPTALTASSVTDTSASVSWTAGGSETQWEYVLQAAGTGIPTGSGTTVGMASVSLTSLTADTLYEVYVRAMCTGDTSSYSSALTFYTGYCIPEGASSANSYIDNFSTSGGITNITNTSSGYGTNGYQDNYNTLSVMSSESSSFNFTSTTVGGTVGAAVWVDWNNDFVFDITERVFNTLTYTSDPSGSVAIPASTANGDYRMRVMIDWIYSNPSTPCSVGRGEIEDYKLIVADLPSCAAPTALIASSVTDTSASVSWTAGGSETQWEYVLQAAAGTGTPTGSGTAVSMASVSLTSLTADTLYEVFVRAMCTGDTSSYSSALTFYTASNVDCGNARSISFGETIEQNTSTSTGSSETIGCAIADKGHWYTFVGNGGIVEIYSEANFDHAIAIGSGSCAGLANISCTDEFPAPYGFSIEKTSFLTTLNEVYFIYIADYDPVSATTGDITVRLRAQNSWDGTAWSLGASPSNLEIAVINGDFTTGASNDGDLDAALVFLNTGTTTIPAGTFMKSQGDIEIDASASLLVQHEGSVVQVDDASTVTNDGSITVEKITPSMAAQSFMISGSPMTGETREGVFGSAYIVRNHDTSNFVPNAAVAAQFPSANNFADDNGDNWITHTGGLNPGEGYLVFPQPDGTSSGSYTQNHTSGTLNNGVFSYPYTLNAVGTPSENQNASPFMLSNPYASAIDAELFFDDPANSGIDVVYFWEHNTPLSTYPGYNSLNFSMADISMYQEGIGGVPMGVTNIISSGQGFAVKPSADGTIVFNNAMRLTGPNDSYRSNNTFVNRDRLWLSVINDTYELESTALIAFTENTSDTYNTSEDVTRLPTPVSLYCELDTNQELAINALAPFDISDAFYLSFSTQVKELQGYRISIQGMDGANFENATVYLIDALTGSVSNLSQGDYTFQSGEATYSKRFKVVFENGALGTNDATLEAVSLYPNPTQNTVTIVSPQTAVKSATVYDIQGRKVSEVDFSNTTSYQVDLSNLEAAIYLVSILTDNGVINKRVIKNN
jgi:hypothetical protein